MTPSPRTFIIIWRQSDRRELFPPTEPILDQLRDKQPFTLLSVCGNSRDASLF